MMGKIEVIGLGAGDIEQLPLGVYRKLTQTDQVIYTRTLDHPVIGELEKEGVRFDSFDSMYEESADFTTVYENIVAFLLERGSHHQVIYTVPGHPMLAERTVQLLLEQNEVEVEITGGQSYLDALFTSLKIDPIEGFQFVDGTSFERRRLNYEEHLVFSQVYDSFIASEVKLELLEDLPADYEVIIVEAAGTKEEKLTKIPLVELDRSVEVTNLTSVYIPPTTHENLTHHFSRLVEVVAALRGPGGCPWDQVQTHESLRKHTIEEVYELLDAIDNEDDENIIEELGDLLMHVVLHSQIGTDSGYFTIDDVIHSITTKMIHRHPHVFGTEEVESVEEVLYHWDVLKEQEKGKKRPSVLDGIPTHLPALAKAAKIQHQAKKVGFDWEDVTEVWEKLDEELTEVNEAITSNVQTDIEDEFGDVLFVIANIMRFYDVNPEVALNRANKKFISRFTYVEESVKQTGKELEDATIEEMEAYWQDAKRRESSCD